MALSSVSIVSLWVLIFYWSTAIQSCESTSFFFIEKLQTAQTTLEQQHDSLRWISKASLPLKLSRLSHPYWQMRLLSFHAVRTLVSRWQPFINTPAAIISIAGAALFWIPNYFPANQAKKFLDLLLLLLTTLILRQSNKNVAIFQQWYLFVGLLLDPLQV